MSAEFLKAALFRGYGSSMYIGIGIPIPVLNSEIAKNTGIGDREIETDIIDYSIPSRARPVLGRCNYEQLKSGSVDIAGREVLSAPLASPAQARKVALALKKWIETGSFFLSEPAAPLPAQGSAHPLSLREPTSRPAQFYRRQPQISRFHATPFISWNEQSCISCGQCLAICPERVFRHDADWQVTAELERCRECGRCERVCPRNAIVIKKNEP
jgi:Pyruvate/2-oxoacid:ferredoxin oxidoreductase delta subunit